MKKAVKIWIFCFFITAVLSMIAAIAVLVSLILFACGSINVLAVKTLTITNVVVLELFLVQAYSLLKLPTSYK